MDWIRCRLSFGLFRSAVMYIRGSRAAFRRPFHCDRELAVIVIVIVIVILYSAGTYIYIMDEKSLKCDDALKDCWRNQQPKHKSLQNTTTKTHRYRTLRTFIART